MLIGNASSLVTDSGQMPPFFTGNSGSTPARFQPSF